MLVGPDRKPQPVDESPVGGERRIDHCDNLVVPTPPGNIQQALRCGVAAKTEDNETRRAFWQPPSHGDIDRDNLRHGVTQKGWLHHEPRASVGGSR